MSEIKGQQHYSYCNIKKIIRFYADRLEIQKIWTNFFKYSLPKLTKGKGNMKSLISVKGIQSVI